MDKTLIIGNLYCTLVELDQQIQNLNQQISGLNHAVQLKDKELQELRDIVSGLTKENEQLRTSDR